jgi:hypothetical protein
MAKYAGSPQEIVDWLKRERGAEAIATPEGDVLIRNPQTKKWESFDAPGLDLGDIADVLPSVEKIGAMTGGAILGGVAGATAAPMALEVGRQVGRRNMGFGVTPMEVATEGLTGGLSEVGGQLIGKAASQAIRSTREALPEAFTHRAAEILETTATKTPGITARDLRSEAEKLGVGGLKDRMTKSDVAMQVYRAQKGAPAMSARMARKVGADIDATAPGRFSEAAAAGGETGARTFKIRRYSQGQGKIKEYEAMYGQPRQRTEEEIAKIPWNDARTAPLKGGESQVPFEGREAVNKYILEKQRGAVKGAWPPEVTREKDLLQGRRTMVDMTIPEFERRAARSEALTKTTKPFSGGWESPYLDKIIKITTKEGTKDYSKISGLSKVLRSTIGRSQPLGKSKLEIVGEALEGIGRESSRGGSRLSHWILPSLLFGHGGKVAVGSLGAKGSGAILKGIGALLRGEPKTGGVVGRALGRLIYDPQAPAGTKTLVTRILRAIERGQEREVATLLMALMGNHHFRKAVEAETQEKPVEEARP